MMSRQSPPKRPTSRNRYPNPSGIPSMATPRKSEPPKKMGFLGFVFMIGILGGLVWLIMLIFGLGPYESEVLPTKTATPSQTLMPSTTPTVSMTAFIVPSSTSTLTSTPTTTQTPTPELLPFILFGEPEMMSSALIRPRLDCNWLVIAGQVWDLQGEPVIDSVSVHLFGELEGYSIDQYRLPGTETAYGESGYEFALEGLLVDSENTLCIQLVDANDLPLSHPYLIQTFVDCQKNLILVNFKQVR